MLRTPRARRPRLPLTVRLLGLYPQGWRDRYGEELAELLAVEPVTPAAIFYVLAGALDAHLHRDLVGGEALTGTDTLRAAVLGVFCASVSFAVAALAFYEAVNDLSFAPLMRLHRELTGPWTVLAAGAAVTLAAVLAGGLPILVAASKDAWARRRGDLRLFLVPPLALLVLCGCDGVDEVLRSRHLALPSPVGLTLDVVFHALFVLAAGVSAASICILVARSTVAVRLFRFALLAAVLAILAMVVTAGATVVWLADASAADPDRLGVSPVGIGFALLVVLLAASTGLAANAVVRSLMAQAPRSPVV